MSEDPLAIANDLRDLITEHRDETESQRQIAQPIVEKLVETRLCRMALPAASGGLETSPVESLAVYEALAAAEASVAWVVWNNSLVCWFARYLSPDVRDEIFGKPSLVFANSTRPSGKAVLEGNRYRISGRWGLVSGCMHADWIPVMCLLEENGRPQMVAPDTPGMRMFFVPRDRYEILDTWYVGGLRGTGSHDVVLEDVAVSSDRSIFFTDPSLIDTPFGRVPITITMAAGCASICLGIAQSAIDTVIELGRTKISPGPAPDLRDRASNQSTLARTSTTIEALRSHLRTTYGRIWSMAQAGDSPSHEELADAWGACISTALACRDAVTATYAMAGTSALYVDCPIERAHRDIHAVLQHIVLQPLFLEQAGMVKLGLEPDTPLFYA